MINSLLLLDNQQENEAQSHQKFIERLVPRMPKNLQDGYGVLPSIILGQAILESNWGKRGTLASKYNNLFGSRLMGIRRK